MKKIAGSTRVSWLLIGFVLLAQALLAARGESQKTLFLKNV